MPKSAPMPRMAMLIFDIFHVSGFASCPNTETSPRLPLCVSMNFTDCANMPPDPQHGS